MRSLFFVLLSFFLLINSYSQGGSIRGIIVDANSRETLIGTNVMIQGSTRGTTSNFDGEYLLSNIDPGEYTLIFSFISYEQVIVEKVRVGSGRETTLNMELKPATQQIEGVTVAARRVQHTDISMISSIRTSELVVSGVSAQQISKSQDRDASQVVRRIPGVSIQDDKFIVIRGLSSRYNYTMLNDATAPSMEADVRSFAFDIVPSSQLERILIFKSPAADLPGDFGGGVVKVYTRGIPDESGFEFSYTTSYEPGSSFKPFYNPERGDLHWTGLDRGFHDLPKGTPADIRSIKNDVELQRIGRQFQNNWVPEKTNSFVNQGASMTGSFKFNLGKILVGHITSINYSNSRTINNVNRYDYNSYNLIEKKSLPIYWYADDQYNQSIKSAILHNWGFRFSPRHTVEFRNLLNQITSYQYILRGGQNYDFQYYPSNHSFQHLYRNIYSGQLTGKHEFFQGKTKIDWIGGIMTSARKMPDYKRYRSDLPSLGGDPVESVIYVPIGGSQPYFLGRFYSNMDESTETASMNLTQNIVFSESSYFKPQLKAGVFFEQKDRDFLARNIGYTQAVGFDQALRELPINEFFHPDNINNYGGVKIDEQSNPNDSYKINSSLLAYYVSLSIPLTRKFKAVIGSRIENFDSRLISATTGGPVDISYPSVDFLPSVNLSYNFTDKMLLRLAYGKTLNRPEFRERAPFSFYDFDFNLVKSGNIYITNATIHNYDFRWELYPSVSEMITLGIFYKRFINPIEQVFEPGAGSGGAKNFTYSNAESAESKGIELEFRKSLIGITSSRFIDDISILANAAFIDSEIKIGKGSASKRDTENRPLQGQSPYLINTGLFYNNVNTDLQVTVLYNIVGKRIHSVGFTNLDRTRVLYPDLYEMPRSNLDVTLSKTFKNKYYVKAGVTDILNQYNILLQDANEDGKFDKNKDQISQKYKPGSLYTLTLGIKL